MAIRNEGEIAQKDVEVEDWKSKYENLKIKYDVLVAKLKQVLEEELE